MYRATVRADTVNPNRASSAWTRRCPQRRFSTAILRMRARSSPAIRGRSSPGPPSPVGRPSPAMPAEHGRGLNHEEELSPSGNPPTGGNPEPAVAVSQPGTWRSALKHEQLLPQAQILGDQVRSGCEPSRDGPPRPPDHAEPPSILALTGVFHRSGHKERTVDRFLRPTGLGARRTPAVPWRPLAAAGGAG